MYTLTLSAAAVLNSDHRRVVLYAIVGVVWGWAVAGVAFLPYAILLLLVGAPIVYLPAGVVFLVGTMAPMVAFDRLFYGKWTVSPAAYWQFVNLLLHNASSCNHLFHLLFKSCTNSQSILCK